MAQNASRWTSHRRGLIVAVFYISAVICIINVWHVSTKMFSLYGANSSRNRSQQRMMEKQDGSASISSEQNIQTSTEEAPTKTSGAVIVTKVLWPKDLPGLKEWICLINLAYNDKAKHDVVVFTTMPWEEHEILELQQAALPSNVTVALEGPPLEEQLAAMTDEEVKFLRKRCGIQDENDNETLTYFHYCTEPNYRHTNNLGYAWQAEFRAYHIWTHPAIAKYKYMIWFDADASVGTNWDVDPMKYMVEHDLTLMYAQFPYGHTGNHAELGGKLKKVYGTNMCGVGSYDGIKHIYAKVCNDTGASLDQIGGNHHITNLDVYRKDIHQHFLKLFVGDFRFRRSMDDQMAVTIVATMEQYIQNNYTTGVPTKPLTWHERSNGMTLKIGHHRKFDGKKDEFAPAVRGRFYDLMKDNFTGLEERCGAIFNKK